MRRLLAREWRAYYADERARLGDRGLDALVRAAPELALPEQGALVFPHAKLVACGRLVAAVARAIVRSGRDRVVALGVLHGGRERDAAAVEAARRGDEAARASLRGVHTAEGDVATEEFSLDAIEALLAAAARVEGRRAPTLLRRYPFLVGEGARDLPGIEAIRAEIEAGAGLVATGDLVHHGVGYATPPERARSADDPATRPAVEAWIREGLGALARGDTAAFLAAAEATRSDFRDAGPTLAALLGAGDVALEVRLLGLELVGYGDVLEAPDPTWVGAALAAIAPAAGAGA